MVKLYSYIWSYSLMVTTNKEEAEEYGINGILYGTLVNSEPKWRDENMIFVGDIICSTTGENYLVEKIIACR